MTKIKNKQMDKMKKNDPKTSQELERLQKKINFLDKLDSASGAY